MAKRDIPLQVDDYLVLPLTFKPCESFPEPVLHYLYLHPHDPKIPTPEAPRSLFLVNIPIDTTETHIKHLFSTQLDLPSGRIEAVQFEGAKPKTSALLANAENGAPHPMPNEPKSKKRKRAAEPPDLEKLAAEDIPPVWDRQIHKSGSTTVVVFVDRASMEAAFKAAKRSSKAQKTILWGDGIEDQLPPLGSARYLTHSKLIYPPTAELLASVDAYMTAFAANEDAEAKARTKQRQEPDEDGFVMVTRGGRSGRPATQEEVKEKAERQKEKNKGFDDFYRFQTRERQKERAKELVRKFEEDKEKVRKMRERRGKFRPE